ncbi:MAG: hypothetical protein IJ864_02235 [Alphaproteobacteria bacterium]|nr:hypothetical protein [Alphaproteobacteria bacterium]
MLIRLPESGNGAVFINSHAGKASALEFKVSRSGAWKNSGHQSAEV